MLDGTRVRLRLVREDDLAVLQAFTEAVGLLTAYLFDRTKGNRIRLVIHPDNAASRRVAEKAGYSLEGVARGAWYHRGRNHDVEIWSVLRAEHRAARDAPPAGSPEGAGP